MARLGVGIICYENFKDTFRCLRSIKFHTQGHEVVPIVWDNSEKETRIRDYVTKAYPNAIYLNAGKNVGCAVSRNLLLAEFLKKCPNAQYLVIMDMDVTVLDGWLDAMLRIMDRYPRCGIAAWPIANLGSNPMKKNNGCVSEIASVCNLHRIKPLLLAKKKWGGPWEKRFFFHRFDTLICDRLNQLGWRTHLVLEGYKPKKDWQKQQGLILHNHAHRGIKSYMDWRKVVLKSRQLYNQIMKKEGWKKFDPLKDKY